MGIGSILFPAVRRSPKTAALGLLCELAAEMRQRKSLSEFRSNL
ncbi:hypothetical protein Hdeb2414_s0005g00159981 [Helianthus debilis subsp. tardiflorus]